MQTRELKTGFGWVLQTEYEHGLVRWILVSQADGRRYGDSWDLGINKDEWEAFVKWMDYVRADEQLKARR